MVGERLDALRVALVKRFAAEEKGGYFSAVRNAKPELDGRVEHLWAQHAQLLLQLDAAKATAAQARPSDVRAEVDRLVVSLRIHEAAENELMQDAMLQDTGRGG